MTRTKLALKVLALFLTIAFVFADGPRAQDASAPNADEPGAMISQALRLYSAGDCAAALPLGEKAAEQLRTQNKATADLGLALVVQALCLKKLARVTEAEPRLRNLVVARIGLATAVAPFRAVALIACRAWTLVGTASEPAKVTV